MSTIQRRIAKGAIIVYAAVMPVLMGILLFILPAMQPRPYFLGSGLADFVVRLVLWLYLMFGYGSASYALLVGLRKGHLWNIGDLERDARGLVASFGISVGTGFMLGVLTWGSFQVFLPQVDDVTAMALATGNGLAYAAVTFCEYFFLPENI